MEYCSSTSLTLSRKSARASIAGRPKPHPDGAHDAARLLGVPPALLLVVGDYVFDIAAGKAAGALTALLTNGRPEAVTIPAPDFTIAKVGELEGLLGL